jgi:hypothetical protein
LTTAGVTFFTISENPCAIAGGTPAACAVGSPGIGLRVHAIAKRQKQLARPRARPSILHLAITGFLQKVIETDVRRMNGVLYTIHSEAFKDK